MWNLATTKFNNALKGDGDGDTPEDTNVARSLRAYYTDEKKSKNYPEWPEWMPGPRPATLPMPAQVSSIGSSYGAAPTPGSRYGSAQEASRNPYSQQDAGGMNDSGPQAVSARPNQTLQALWNKPRAPANAAARGAGVGSSRFERNAPKSDQPKPQPRLMPSQTAGSYQRHQQSYSSSANGDPYSQNSNMTTGRGGYESRSRPSNGYGSSRSTDERPYMSSSSPWVTGEGAGGTGHNGYADREPEPSSLRTGRGPTLPGNPRQQRRYG